jgi:hypothetical protein
MQALSASFLAICMLFLSVLIIDAFHARLHIPKRLSTPCVLREYQYHSQYQMTNDFYGVESMDDDDYPSEESVEEDGKEDGDDGEDDLGGPATGQFKLGKKKLPTILQGEPLKPPPFRQRRATRTTSLTDNLIIVGTTIVTLSILVAGFLFVNKDLSDRPPPGSRDPMSRL